MPPLLGVEEDISQTQDVHKGQDPVAERSNSESDDDQTLAFILKKRSKAADPSKENPDAALSLPESHPTRFRAVVWKRKASESASLRYVLVSDIDLIVERPFFIIISCM